MIMMRRLLMAVAIVLLPMLVCAQVHVGLRDNQYVQLGYLWKQTWKLELEHSVFSQKFSTQYVRQTLGYQKQWKKLGLKVSPLLWDYL